MALLAACVAMAVATYSVDQAAVLSDLSRPSSIGGVGPMHIPAAWLPILSRIGFSEAKVLHDPCTNVAAGAWIMAYENLTNPSKSHRASPPAPKFHASPAEVSPACEEAAADRFHLSLTLLKGILATEGGHIGQVHWNDNGTYDMGPAQVNSIWLPQLEAAGITRDQVINDGCLNVAIGAWILSQAMTGANPKDPAQFWRHVGDYNSATPAFNDRYARLVWSNIATK